MKKILTTLIIATIAGPCLSNDGHGELGLGGVIKLSRTPVVSMEKETLEVSPTLIRVDYVFANNWAKSDPKLQVLFPLPLYGAEKPSWEWAGAPNSFTTTVNGKKTAFKSIVKARLDTCPNFENERFCSKDVTGDLKAAGLTDEQIALFPDTTPFRTDRGAPVAVSNLTKAQQDKLLKAGLLSTNGPSGEPYYPTWLADVTYAWEMDFKGQKTIDVSHQYVPFTSGGAESTNFDEDTLRNDYCAEDSTINALRKWSKEAHPLVNDASTVKLNGSRVEYILTTANTWNGSIRDFTLRLKKSSPSEVVLLCFPGKVRKLDPLTLEINLKNFAPKNELRVLFLHTSAEMAYDSKPGAPPVIAK